MPTVDLWTIKVDFEAVKVAQADLRAKQATLAALAKEHGLDVKTVGQAYQAAAREAAKAAATAAREAEQAAAKETAAKAKAAKDAAKAVADEVAQVAKLRKEEFDREIRWAAERQKVIDREAKEAAKAAEKAAASPSEWTLALQANTKALAEQHSAINKSKEATGALGAAFAALSPDLGAAVMGIQKIEGVLGAGAGFAEVFGASLGTVAAAAGPLGLAVGAVGLAWHEHNKEAEKAKERLKDATEAANGTKAAMTSLGDLLYDNTIQQQLLNKEITQTEADQLRAARSLEGNYLPAFAKQATTLAVAEAHLSELRREQEKQQSLAEDQLRNTLPAATAAVAQQTAEVEKQRIAYAALSERYKQVHGLQESNIKTEGELKDAKKEGTKATKDAAEAEREKTAADKAALEALNAQIKRQRDLEQAGQDTRAAAEKLRDVAKAANDSQLTGVEALLAAQKKEAAAIEEQYQAALQAAGPEGGVELHEAYTEALLAVDKKYAKEKEKLDKKTTADEKKNADALKDAKLRAAAETLGTLQNGLSDWAEGSGKTHRKAAQVAFRASQVAGIAEAEIKAYQTAANVFTQTSAIPGGIAFAPAAAAAAFISASAASVVPIAKEKLSFSDRTARAGSGGMTADFAPGDYVVAAQRPEDVQRQAAQLTGNAPSAPVSTTIIFQADSKTRQALVVQGAKDRRPGAVGGARSGRRAVASDRSS